MVKLGTTGPKKARKPLWYHAPDREPVLLAGVFDNWKDPRTDTSPRQGAAPC